MAYSRHAVAAALTDVLPTTYKVVPDPRSLGELDPSKSCYVQIVRQRIRRAPANPLGDYQESFEVWVIEPNVDPANSEDNLDDKLQEVIDAIDSIRWLGWTSAERRIHKSEHHAYMIAVEAFTDKEIES